MSSPCGKALGMFAPMFPKQVFRNNAYVVMVGTRWNLLVGHKGGDNIAPLMTSGHTISDKCQPSSPSFIIILSTITSLLKTIINHHQPSWATESEQMEVKWWMPDVHRPTVEHAYVTAQMCVSVCVCQEKSNDNNKMAQLARAKLAGSDGGEPEIYLSWFPVMISW